MLMTPRPPGSPPVPDPPVLPPPGGAHRGSGRAARHEPRGRPASRGLVAELAVAVVAPAIGGARGRDPTRVVVAGAHRGEAHAAHQEHGGQSVSRGPVAELAEEILAPAI